MTTVASKEAKIRLPRLLERVASGERITITKRGVPVAMLVPVEPPAKPKPDFQEIIEGFRQIRRRTNLHGLTIKQLIEEGRRY